MKHTNWPTQPPGPGRGLANRWKPDHWCYTPPASRTMIPLHPLLCAREGGSGKTPEHYQSYRGGQARGQDPPALPLEKTTQLTVSQHACACVLCVCKCVHVRATPGHLTG